MRGPLPGLDVTNPVLAAPMAGGASTPGLVAAAADAGSLGFLAAGYKTPEQLAAQIREVRQRAPRSGEIVFGVNLFAPRPVPVDPASFRAYARALQPDADHYGIDLSAATPVEDDDSWTDKIDLLLTDPVPLVSFTFAVPDPATVAKLKDAGTHTAQTVTTVAEARAACDAGLDMLVVQGYEAGAHSGTTTPQAFPAEVPLTTLVAAIRQVTGAPLIAAGGLSTPAEVAAVLQAGADAVMVGTMLLRSPESGASGTHKAALADPGRGDPVLTRAFTGRPARGLPNAFIRKYDPIAPSGYPALHHLTSGLRKAAAAAGNAELVHLWAGTGYRNATAEPAAAILRRLAQDAPAVR
jgi:NAD(P)H-dependent flavin oxidoreductase YrpB (nitropropane dioxygenase family)